MKSFKSFLLKRRLFLTSLFLINFSFAEDARDTQILLVASISNDLGTVTDLIANGADIHIKNKDGKTLLHLAVEYEHLEVVKALIEAGAEINARDINGKTPLHYAFTCPYAFTSNDKELVELLITKGADVNARDKYGNTPLHLAIKYEDVNIVNDLLELGADINARDNMEKLLSIISLLNFHLLALPFDIIT
ncbi:MAG: ankyrin repeat domain-containing protein [Bdellovibrionales bacterium]|nr:ankyrin repeat domain-containing protein [Bdellovibrionales bacterium]